MKRATILSSSRGSTGKPWFPPELNGLPALLLPLLLIFTLSSCNLSNSQSPSSIALTVDASQPKGEIDLTRYSLGQGGYSPGPQIDKFAAQIRQLHPPTIRLFVQEYFDLYPAHGQYHWEALDNAIQAILATGAVPIMNLCFKPKVLYPRIDEKLVQPTSWEEWEQLVSRLVKHCNQDEKYGIKYWEVANEPNTSSGGGTPYSFTPQEYLPFYTHTVGAILRADPGAKVGGPALAGVEPEGGIGDALIKYCGEGKAPLDFFSWHIYNNDPRVFEKSIRDFRSKLAKYPRLSQTETVLDEWNMSLSNPIMNPYFQPAFILDVTDGFYSEGLSRSAYYEIADVFVDRKAFLTFMSKSEADAQAHAFNVIPRFLGLYDNLGRVRPAYYAFKLLSLIKGDRLAINGLTSDVKGFAALNNGRTEMVFWNFPLEGKGKTFPITLNFPSNKSGRFILVGLDPESAVSNLEVIQAGNVSSLQNKPLRVELSPYKVYWIEIAS